MRLRTIGPIIALALGLLAGPLPAEAQQAGKVYRIGFLDYRLRSTTTDPALIALRQGLRELGYVEGKNICPIVGAPHVKSLLFQHTPDNFNHLLIIVYHHDVPVACWEMRICHRLTLLKVDSS